MSWLGEVTDWAGDLYGKYTGTTQQNAANRDMSREQMDFQQRMSDTSHQREVKDLRKAGLNPILSANAGASTPPGSTAQMQASSMEGAVDTYKDFKRLKNEQQSIESQIQLNQSAAAKNSQDVQTNIALEKMYQAEATTAKGDPRYWIGKSSEQVIEGTKTYRKQGPNRQQELKTNNSMELK